MGRLFLPGQVVSAENQGTFSDYHFNDNKEAKLEQAYGGSYWQYVTDVGCGIFLDNDGRAEFEPGTYGSDLGSRLSKN